ncbi:TPA: c-type cytochrome [Candidatus Poribacteria bacterium]|nr:c-type cytochrome [Candidatus Poribacteria bacterium]
MKKIFAALSIVLFMGISFAIVSAQMGGMMPGGMGPGGGPWNIGPGMMDGQWDGREYESNGERIFFTGINDAGERIRFSGGPWWLWMHGGGCASCHGTDGRGGFPVMMGTEIPPNITYEALTLGEHEHGGGEEAGEEHEPYTDELIKQAIAKGLDASGEPLDLTMPRWQMNDEDLNNLIDYLKTLSAEEEIGEEVNIDKAKEIAQEYLFYLNFPDLTLGELVEYNQSFVVKYQEKSTGRYAFDVLLDKHDGGIYPAMGPTMGWNTKYGGADGMMGGMQGGMMGDLFGDTRVNLDEAQRLAQKFLAQNNLQMTLNSDHLHLYYGFYEFHCEKDGLPTYLIAVNGYTGQVFYETWLGQIVSIADLSGITTGDLPQIAIKPDQRIVRNGDTFSLDIAVEKVAQLSGYQFDLIFDPAILQAKTVTEGTFLKRDGADTFWKEPVIDNNKGQISVAAARTTKGGIDGAGALATATFEATKEGESVVALENPILSNPKGEVLSVSASGATVIVQGRETPWDVNGDGRVDILDLVLVGQRLGETVTLHEPPDPDVNQDGAVNVIDLVLIGQHLGEEYSQPAAPSFTKSVLASGVAEFARIPASAPALSRVERISETGLFKVDVQITSAVDLYGFQFDVQFDKDKLEVVNVKEGALLKRGGERTFFSPKVDANTALKYGAGGTISIAATRLATKIGADGEGTLATLVLRLKGKDAKEALLRLQNIQLVDSQSRLLLAQPKAQTFRIELPLLPKRSVLLQNYPNPFNPETWIPYQLQEDSNVTIHIYTVAGQLVRTLRLGYKPAGIYTSQQRAAYWDGRDSTGQRVSSGVYFYTLIAKATSLRRDRHDEGYFTATRKLIIQK